MSFSTGGLLLNESLVVTSLHELGEDWGATLRRALEAGSTSLPKTASNRRTLREIVNRLMRLSDEERDALLHGDRADQQALLWLSTCRAYQFVAEFTVEVIQDRFLTYRYDLPLEQFDIFFDRKAEWNDALQGLSEGTRKKLRQIMFRMMREASIISAENRILPAFLSGQILAMIMDQNPQELQYFPGIPVQQGII
jgi:hypothetical protein